MLGSLLYKKEEEPTLLNNYEQTLYENAYDSIWDNLTPREKDILLASIEDVSQKYICEKLNMTNGSLQNYKKRLIHKGLLKNEVRGELVYTFPRFKEFLQLQALLSD